MKDVTNKSRIKRYSGERLKDNLQILGVHFERKLARKYTEREYWDILEKAAAQYQHWRKEFHPDNGGDAEEFDRLHKAWLRVKSLFARMGFVLHKEVINRDELLSGKPFEVMGKTKRVPFVPESIKQKCLKHAGDVHAQLVGRYDQFKNATALRRTLMEMGIVFPDPQKDPEAHYEIIQILYFFGHAWGISKHLKNESRNQNTD